MLHWTLYCRTYSNKVLIPNSFQILERILLTVGVSWNNYVNRILLLTWNLPNISRQFYIFHSSINFAEIFRGQDTNINLCHKNMFCCSQVGVAHWVMYSDGFLVRQPMQLTVTCVRFFFNFLPLRSHCCIFRS